MPLLTTGTKLQLSTTRGVEREILLGDQMPDGDLCELYKFQFTDSEPEPEPEGGTAKTCWARLGEDVFEDEVRPRTDGVLKVARFPSNNDLSCNEYVALDRLYPVTQPKEKFFRLLPRLLGRCDVGEHHAVAVSYADGYVSLAEIMEAYPDGLDFRDYAWIIRRVLSVVGFVHGRGWIHGALIPEHVLVHPTMHGAKLIDWSYAVPLDGSTPIKAYVPRREAYYHPAILQRRPPRVTTDLRSVSKCSVALLGGAFREKGFDNIPDSVPEPVRNFVHGLGNAVPGSPAESAWQMYDNFSKILRELVGKPTYRPLEMPA